MYLINKESNDMRQVEKITFKSAGLKERKNLQEYIAKNPESLGEELLIIQKEFSGFDDTNERLDLLALDKKGNLVLIENKLDDTGRDVVWQALKYASYCSSLNGQGIKDIFQDYLNKYGDGQKAETVLENFFEDEDVAEKLNTGNCQRIVLVAGEFRKEVTSTALWLMNFGIRIQCFKVTPYCIKDDILLEFDQIIPVKEAEEYIIKVASKAREEITNQEALENRHAVRRTFWTQFLKESNKRNSIFSEVAPTGEAYIGIPLGAGRIWLLLVVTRKYARVVIHINKGTMERNKSSFDALLLHKEAIEKEFGAPLVWDRMDENALSRIFWQLEGVSVFEKNDYERMNEFLIDGAERMKRAFDEPLKNIR